MWTAPLVAMVVAQGLKPLYMMARLRSWDWRQVRNSGGMPSSHTAAVVALVVELWMRFGGGDPVLAIGFFVAAVVMYDAAGVRWQTGRQAAVLNRLLHDLKGQRLHSDGDHKEDSTDVTAKSQGIHPLNVVKAPWWLIDWPVLNEHVGHKPTEILGGCIVGIVVALLIH